MRRFYRAIGAAGAVAVVTLLGAAPAGASLEGPCEASATFVDGGFTVDPKTTDKVTIPRADDVEWSGSVTVTEERHVDGSVTVKFPPPIGDVTVGDWESEGEKAANSGTYTYDLPEVLAGFDIPVSGVHHDKGFTCTGSLVVRIDGGGLSSPATLASLGFTVVSGLGLFLAIRARPL